MLSKSPLGIFWVRAERDPQARGPLRSMCPFFYWCASLKPLFAAAVAAPWGGSKGFIISKAYTCLAHTVVSPRSTHENCSLIVLGIGDVPVPGNLQVKVADGIGKTVKK